MERVLKILGSGSNQGDRVMNNLDEVLEVVGFLRKEGKTVGYVPGVFDLFHLGHALYLEKAKTFVDVLIVGVDSDELVKSRKGDSRPIVSFDERVSILVRNRAVDVVIARNLGDDKHQHIKEIRPDVLIISETTKDREGFAEDLKNEYKNYVQKIEVLPAQAETSTTARIRILAIDGAKGLSTKIINVISEHLKGN